ncbi:MAG: Ig-like domain-containing protein [Oscillospiraceae bacterium]|nr:Ig-like domain-containing protein [Oscillospiraceae bacterium]
MSKIICDVCGTSYPETATQCPICGCVRPADVTVVAGTTDVPEGTDNGSYTYVKGGRFSKSNVRKRTQVQQGTNTEVADIDTQEPEKAKRSTDLGLVIAVCVLLLAIVSAVIYISLNFFGAASTTQKQPEGLDTPPVTTTEDTTGITTLPTELDIPCQSVLISKTSVELDSVGAACLLNVTVTPSDTTDKVLFSTSDDLVATVSEDGKIVAVGAGEAVITVTCGSASAECAVVCRIDTTETTAATETTENTETTPATDAEIKLNREDFSLTYKGETWLLYKGDIPVKQIIWTSDNEKVATIVDGVVTATGSGTTTVYAEYNGAKVSCIVRCKPSVGKADEVTPTESTAAGEYNISATDVTLQSSVSESFELKLLDADNKAVDVEWSVADNTICTVSGNKVTALSAGKTEISVTYEGVKYACIVRVK